MLLNSVFFQSTPSDPVTPGGQSTKSLKAESGRQSKKSTPQKSSKGKPALSSKTSHSQPQTIQSTVQVGDVTI